MTRRRALAAALVATALTVSLAGCSERAGSGGNGGNGNAGPTAAVTTSVPLSVTGAVDLRRLVVNRAPDGYQLLASPPFGAVDLPRLLEEFSDAPVEDRAILEGARFRAGYTRGWLKEDAPRSFLGVFVFEFADEEGARSARDGFAAQNATRKGATRFPVDGIVDAIGESYTKPVEGGEEQVHLVTFVRGARMYLVGGHFDDLDATVDETVRFAEAEDRVAA